MTELPDHIGWDLTRVQRWWKAAFIEDVVAAGHPWFREARGRMAEFIGRDGAEQGVIVARSGLTKQAVALHLDALEADELIRRVPDPADSRKRRVEWTGAGQAALRDIDAAKFRVEARVAERVGAKKLAALKAVLKEIAPDRPGT